MIEPYWGEFLVSPIPLELSLNYCSHKCAYCFANLNDPKRKGDVKAIMRFLQNYTNRETLEATLLKSGYPVLVSNRIDPFSYSNYQSMVGIIDVMAQLEIPVTIQTKGGPGVDKVLDFLPPSVWYVSISMLDDELRKKIEPGAPTIESRFELIEKLRNKGHRVVLGYNPVVPEWGVDHLEMLQRAKAAGVEGVWIEELHLNYRQERNLSQREREALGDDLIDRARKRKRQEKDNEVFFAARNTALELGLEIFSNGQPNRSDFWKIYRDVYPVTFPTNQDFVNFCHDNGLDGQVLSFEHWAKVVLDGLPLGRFRMNKYIGGAALSVFETYKVPSKLTYWELLGIIWQVRRAKQSPVRMPAFAYAALMGQTGWVQLVDDKDFPYLVFDKQGEFTEYFTRVVPIWQAPVDTGLS